MRGEITTNLDLICGKEYTMTFEGEEKFIKHILIYEKHEIYSCEESIGKKYVFEEMS